MNRNDRDRNHRKGHNNGNGSSWKNVPVHNEPRRPKYEVSQKQVQEENSAIEQFKKNQPVCPRCNQPIREMATAIVDRESGLPAHFDCILDYLNNSESHAPEDKITYIGQGRFAVVHYDNPHDTKHFKIERIIEWETKETKADWRGEMAGLYSQTK